MTDAILNSLLFTNNILSFLTVDNALLTQSLQSYMPELYQYALEIINNAALPIAHTILALFFVLEIYRLSVRVEGAGGSLNHLGAEIVFRVLFRLVIFKTIIDSVPTILNGIFALSTTLTSKISAILTSASLRDHALDITQLQPIIEGQAFIAQLSSLLFCAVISLIVGIMVIIAYVIIYARFLEIFIFFSIAPIPLATLPSQELSQIGKNFLKHFAAVCLQGTLIVLILTFIPVLTANALFNPGFVDLYSSLLGVLGYTLVTVIALTSCRHWAKVICGLA
jgi:hypothetical protein